MQIEIWDREQINGEEYVIWCRTENGRTKYWVTKVCATVVKPTSRKRCYEWLASVPRIPVAS